MEMLKQGQRVRLTVDLDNGRLPAGATGYLNKGGWAGAEWGVVFDHEAGLDMKTTHVQLETADGARVRLVDVVEPIDEPFDPSATRSAIDRDRSGMTAKGWRYYHGQRVRLKVDQVGTSAGTLGTVQVDRRDNDIVYVLFDGQTRPTRHAAPSAFFEGAK